MSEKIKQQQEEVRFKIMHANAENLRLTQHKLAKDLEITLGQTTYQLKALKETGLFKIGNFLHSKNKLKYIHILTINGTKEKLRLIEKFLAKKI